MPLGVHLVLTYGRPLLAPEKVPTLVGTGGTFHRLPVIASEPTRLDAGEVRREWARQIERLFELGVDVDHLDSHHHVSYLHPVLTETMLDLAGTYRLPIRRPPAVEGSSSDAEQVQAPDQRGVWMPDLLIGELLTGASTETLCSLAAAVPDGAVAELMVHPGIVDDELRTISTYTHAREAQLRTLLDPTLPERLRRLGIEVVTFATAAQPPSRPGAAPPSSTRSGGTRT